MKALHACPLVLLLAAAVAAQPLLPPSNGGEGAVAAAERVIGTLLPDDMPADTDNPHPELDLPLPTVGEIPAEASPYSPVPEEFWNGYFAARPSLFLIDPQRLLGTPDFRDRLKFLDYHASDSEIDLYVYLFAGDQEIPGDVRDEELIERHFAHGRPAAVVFYFFGDPERAELRFSPGLSEKVSAAERRRALENPVIQAARQSVPARQLEAFLVQMSIRLYWMEKLLAREDAKVPGAKPAGTIDIQPEGESPLMEFAGPHLETAQRHLLPALLLGGSLLAALGVTWWTRRRARYHFPDFEVEPRLGGAHAAGVGAVISFASATVPPAHQRDAMPDYLKRA